MVGWLFSGVCFFYHSSTGTVSQSFEKHWEITSCHVGHRLTSKDRSYIEKEEERERKGQAKGSDLHIRHYSARGVRWPRYGGTLSGRI